MMEKQNPLQMLIHSLYNNKEISLTEEFRKQLLETAKQFSSSSEDLLAVRLSFCRLSRIVALQRPTSERIVRFSGIYTKERS